MKAQILPADYTERGKTVQMGYTCQLYKQKPKKYRLNISVDSSRITERNTRIFEAKKEHGK
jgi:hypothetical protein